MMNKNIIKCIAMLMVSFFIAIPLSRINSHTYTLGVSNVYKPSIICPMDLNYDLNQGYEFNELENY